MDSRQKEQIDKRISSIIDFFLTNSGKTDIDSQIKTMESLNNTVIKTPLFISIIDSLKELRAIKRKDSIALGGGNASKAAERLKQALNTIKVLLA